MVGLLQLPRELRDMIYSHVLTFPNSLEPITPPCLVGIAEYIEDAWKYADWKTVVRPRLGLFRTCKQIHDEAPPCFYGGNTFRFTHDDGWEILEAFMTTIGPRNTESLRRITIRDPVYLQDSDQSQWRRARWTDTTMQAIRFAGLTTPARPKELSDTVRRCMQRLEFAGELRFLDLIATTTTARDGEEGEEEDVASRPVRGHAGPRPLRPLDETRFRDLKIGTVGPRDTVADFKTHETCRGRRNRSRREDIRPMLRDLLPNIPLIDPHNDVNGMEIVWDIFEQEEEEEEEEEEEI